MEPYFRGKLGISWGSLQIQIAFCIALQRPPRDCLLFLLINNPGKCFSVFVLHRPYRHSGFDHYELCQFSVSWLYDWFKIQARQP